MSNNGVRVSVDKEMETKWVALSKENKVVAYDDDLIALDKKVGTQKVTYMRVPESGIFLSY